MSLYDWSIQEDWQRDIDRANKLNELHGCKKSAQAYVWAWKHLLGCEVMYEGETFYITSIDTCGEYVTDVPVVNVQNVDGTVGFRIFADRLVFFSDMNLNMTFKTYVETYWSMQ